MLLLASRVWHAWIAFPLFAITVLMVIGLIVGYVVKVVAPRYPPRQR
jgi:hypothetical protein